MNRLEQQQGYVLITVVVTLFILAAITLLLNRESSLGVNLASSEVQAQQARYVAEAGMRHAIWQTQNSNCVGYPDPLTANFGMHSYTASVMPTSGSPVSIASTGTLSNGVFRSLQRNNITFFQTPINLILQPGPEGKDSFIEGEAGKTNLNNGNHDELKTSSLIGKEYRTLLQFDLSALPASVVIQSAELELYLQSFGSVDVVEAHRLVSDWSENGVTWDTHDGTNSWISAGGDYDPAIAASFLVDGTGPKTANIKELVQAWADGSQPNYGLILISPPNAGGNENKYHSSDKLSEPIPKLSITYACECGASGTAASATLSPLADNTLGAGNDKTKNFETVEDIKASGDGNSDDHALIKFDLSSIPVGATINSASLDLYFEDSSSSGSTNVHVYRLTQDWIPSTATWEIYDTGLSWTSLGGDFDPLVQDSVSVTSGVFGYKNWNVTSLVSEWVAGTHPNYGFLLNADVGFNNATFTSSDSTIVSQHPRLNIDYSCPCGVVCSGGGSGSGSGSGGSSPGSPTTLIATEDSYMKTDRDTDNFGGDIKLSLKSGNRERRSVVRHDVSSLAPGTLITSATLRLYVTSNSENRNVDVFALTETWAELGVSWSERTSGVAWGSAGGSYTTPAVTSVAMSSTFVDNWVEFDITALVQEWVDGINPNEGVILLTDNNRELKLASREDADSTHHPQLVIEYTTP